MKEVSATEYYGAEKGKPAIILGNGPSLKLLDPYLVRSDPCLKPFVFIGMNQSWKSMVAKYHCIMFHKDQLEELQKWDVSKTHLWLFKDYCEMFVRDVKYDKVTFVPSVADPKSELHQYNQFGLISSQLDDASFADMTGHFALELALWLRCDPIYLLGYDLYGKHFCKDSIEGPDGDWRDLQVEMWDDTARQIKLEFKSANVYNLSPESRISGFSKVSIEDLIGIVNG